MNENWTQIVQAISSIVVAGTSVIGFVFLIFQLRQISTSIKSQNHAAIYQTSVELNKILLDNPKYIPYFFENKEMDEDDQDFKKLQLAATIATDFYEYVFTEKNNMDINMRNSWIEYIQEAYANCVYIRLHINQNKSVLNPEFVHIIQMKYNQQQLTSQMVETEKKNGSNESTTA
ncbi:MAG TPA: hypothetical protein PK210_12830 [Bacteroidia bacterium]|nr:hypothetical protein [Bacteroidia bacterium]